MQDMNKQKRVAYANVAGDSNPADLMTKGLSRDRVVYLLKLLGYATSGYHAE